MKDTILSIQNLGKEYRTHWLYKKRIALESVSFDLKMGECLALLGINGAGKTSTIKCILGLVKFKSGEIHLKNEVLNSASQRKVFGFLPEQPYFYQHLNVEETLLFYGNMLGFFGDNNRNKTEEVLKLVDLQGRRRDKIKSLSKGLQQRVGIAQAILNQPEILILDEPFSGLDPIARRQMKELFVSLKEQGTSIIISSHILHDIEQFADRAIFLSKGRIVKERNLKEELLTDSAYRLELTHELGVSSELIDSFLAEFSITPQAVKIRDSVASIVINSKEQADICLHMAMHKGYKIQSFNAEHTSLEDTFLNIAGAK